jgi:hypothetical protein
MDKSSLPTFKDAKEYAEQNIIPGLNYSIDEFQTIEWCKAKLIENGFLPLKEK